MSFYAKHARSTPLGIPGGPCHVIRNIEEESLPDRLKQELISDIEKGKDLTNQQADKLYSRKSLPAKADIFRAIDLTSHAQYRMDQRGVTIPEIQSAFDEFSRWYAARKHDTKLKPADHKLMSDIAYGESVRFDAKRSGITVVFAVDTRKGSARLVSTWWTNQSDPPKPKPGQCDYIPFLDRDRSFERPAILGSVSLVDMAAIFQRKVSSLIVACGDQCDCGGQCECSREGGSCGCQLDE